ncbi:MAG: hypothetical protein NC817_02245 [Candidatus Omnitrophica bacterium]|nr:hypothetical protein [Candidatus Omnitrophota bacterium]MCM8823440.1 hypothetical protein [Candidatus Omnitrophota bacterium]MCM8826470.1 hypothetical protein [Candidatus Omnitrophota bacterium]
MDIKEIAKKHYIAYKRETKNFVELHLEKSKIKLWLDIEKDQLKDPRNLGRDMTGIGHWGTGNIEMKFNRPEDL